jgi:exodeoxyribonuclease-3
MTIKIASWNVNSLRVRLPHVLAWLADAQPDVLALQELKLPTENFPVAEFEKIGYHASVHGQKTWNGVAILSRKPGTDACTAFNGFNDSQSRVLAVTIQDVRVIDVYIPNGESVGSEKYQYKLEWLRHLDKFLIAELKQHAKLVILGDFNIAPEERDVYDPAAWEDKVLFSQPERAAFQQMLKLGLQDCFRLFDQAEKSFSWWDYRLNAFRRNLGLRIDHILASGPLARTCTECHIDKVPRGWERPSDHAPVIASFKT